MAGSRIANSGVESNIGVGGRLPALTPLVVVIGDVVASAGSCDRRAERGLPS
jgi:hypothetical protein